jgi:hypothetical protein
VLITDASWPQRPAFLAALSRCLERMAQRAHWYPGSAQRVAAFKQRFPGAQALGRPVPSEGQPAGHLAAEPFLLVTGGCLTRRDAVAWNETSCAPLRWTATRCRTAHARVAPRDRSVAG